MNDIAGMVFGQLKAWEFFENKNGMDYWRCMCKNGHKQIADAESLKNGRVSRCVVCEGMPSEPGHFHFDPALTD
jgi:hypothetical protein